MTTWALLPVKDYRRAKSRLSEVLVPEERERLMRWMVDRAVAALAETTLLDGVLVVGEPLADARLPRVAHLADPGRGPNAAVAAGLAALASRGADGALVIAGDLPLLRAADLEELARAGQSAGLAIAPDHHDTGTNALYLPLPSPMLPSFGPGSFERHLAAARSVPCEPAVVRTTGLALDIDDGADLEMLRRLDPSVDAVLGAMRRETR